MSAVDTHAGPIGEVRAAGAANGVALTTTAAFTSFPTGANYLTLIPRNAATAVVVRYALNPYLIVIKTTDDLQTVANVTDPRTSSENLQDGDTGTVLNMNSFAAVASNNFLYIGSHAPFRGVRVIIGNTNSNASVLTVKYWNGSAWTDITATDGTAAAGATLAATGNVTWTVPTGWTAASLVAIGIVLGGSLILPDAMKAVHYLMEPEIYWTRWEVSLALDATVTITGMQSMNRSTTYAEFLVNLGKELRIYKGHRGTGCLEALTDAGTANLLIEAATLGVGSKFL